MAMVAAEEQADSEPGHLSALRQEQNTQSLWEQAVPLLLLLVVLLVMVVMIQYFLL
jgi:hypothetical protein